MSSRDFHACHTLLKQMEKRSAAALTAIEALSPAADRSHRYGETPEEVKKRHVVLEVICRASTLRADGHGYADQTVRVALLQYDKKLIAYSAIRLISRSMTMYIDSDRFHSSIACQPDSLEPKLMVKLLTVKASERTGDPTKYVVHCSLANTDLEWSVERRYSEFRELQKVLHGFFFRRGGGARSQCFGCVWFAQTLRSYWFPRRHVLLSRSPNVINQRRVGLYQFMLILSSHTFSAVPKCTSCAKTIFPVVRDFVLRGAILPATLSLNTLERMLQPEYFSPVADPSKSKLEFRKARSVWKVLQMEKPVFSKLSELHQQQHKQNEQWVAKPLSAMQ